jgi:hypothetical protein
LFDAHADEEGRVPTKTLLEKLAALVDSPWQAYGRTEKPIHGAALAALLRRFDIHPTKPWDGGVRGYCWADFQDAVARYLPHPPDPIRNPATASANIDKIADSTCNAVAGANGKNVNDSGPRCGIAGLTPEGGTCVESKGATAAIAHPLEAQPFGEPDRFAADAFPTHEYSTFSPEHEPEDWWPGDQMPPPTRGWRCRVSVCRSLTSPEPPDWWTAVCPRLDAQRFAGRTEPLGWWDHREPCSPFVLVGTAPIPQDAFQLHARLRARGCRLRADGGRLWVGPGHLVNEADRTALTRWRHHVAMLVAFDGQSGRASAPRE